MAATKELQPRCHEASLEQRFCIGKSDQFPPDSRLLGTGHSTVANPHQGAELRSTSETVKIRKRGFRPSRRRGSKTAT